MLPSLAAVFVLGLLCGAQMSIFPLSVIVLLAGIAVGFSLLERVGYIDSPSALFLYSSQRWLRLIGQVLPVHKWRLAVRAYAAEGCAGRCSQYTRSGVRPSSARCGLT